MPSQRAIEALIELRRKQQQNTTAPSLITDYNFNLPNQTIEDIVNKIPSTVAAPTPETPTTTGSSLLDIVYAGSYEWVEGAGFGLPGLLESALLPEEYEEYGPQAIARQVQEENKLARIAGGVGRGIGYITGLPVKLTGRLLRAPMTRIASGLLGKQTLGQATRRAINVKDVKGLDKTVVNEFSNILNKTAGGAVTKALKADDVFKTRFNSEINQLIDRGIRSGTLNKAQSTVIRNMADSVVSKGIPVQNLNQLARVRFGDNAVGRFASEALHDAFMFSIADGIMESVLMGQEYLQKTKGTLASPSWEGYAKEYDTGRMWHAMGTGFLMGTGVNLATAPFRPLGKMTKSRKDFRDGIRAFLNTDRYKGKDLAYLSKQMVNLARTNKLNGKETKISWSVKGEKNYIDLQNMGMGNRALTERNVERRLREEFGDNAEDQARKWLMRTRRQYGKELMSQARREGFKNYAQLLPRMGVGGLAMAGTQGVYAHVYGQELQAEDFISSMIIGAWTQRRGNFARRDWEANINNTRQSLKALGIDVENTFYASTLSRPNDRFGVGLVRDNAELTEYLREQRIISDDDATITSDVLPEGEKSFLDFESGTPFDPHDGKMNVLYQLMSEDFRYSKTLDQISQTQANEIMKILDRQGFKTVDDLNTAFEDRVIESTKGIEQNIQGVLQEIVNANLDGINIEKNSKGIITPSIFKASDELLKKARNGDFEKWLDGKSGQEAEEALLDMFRSLEMVAEISKGLRNATSHKIQSNTVQSEESLKRLYNIVRDSEKSINESTENFDGRKEFRYTDVESYLMPIIQNKGNNVTKLIMDTLNPDITDDKLESLLLNSGILQEVVNSDGRKELMIVDDYGKINSESPNKALDLGKIHGILKAIGKYTVTESPSKREVTDTEISALKGYLGKWVDDLNAPNLEFMYSMVLKDINRTRLNNSVISPADVDFIVQQSALASFGKAGLIKDKNIQGFLLRKLNIPSNVELQEKYNAILKRLNEETDGLVQILDDHYHLVNESSAVELAQRLDEMYIGRDKSEENIVLQELFDAMTNTKLDSVKSKMLEYITSFGDEGQLQLLSMLKFQGIIKRNVDNKLELIEEDKLIQKFEESDLIERTLEKRGFKEEFVQNQIEKRKELHRLYIGDSSDTVKNPSLNLDGFFKKYNLIYLNEDGNNEYLNYENEDSLTKKTIFENEIFDEMGNITDVTVKRLAERIAVNNIEYNDLRPDQKKNIIQDINQIVFGAKDRRVVRKISIVNDKIIEDPKGDVQQDNPVFRFFRELGLDYAIFDNNVIKTVPDQGGNWVERTYNILSTEDIPDYLKKQILKVRQTVQSQLQELTLNPSTEQLFDYRERKRGDASVLMDEETRAAPNDIGIKKLDIYDGMDSIVIKTTDMRKIVDEFDRFYEEHYDKVDTKSAQIMKSIKDAFDKTENPLFYDEDKIELAMRYLVLEVGYKSKTNDLFYKILSSTDPKEVDSYIKRVKLFTTKNFVRPSKEYITSIMRARAAATETGTYDKVSRLLNKRLKKDGYDVAIWDDDIENMQQLIRDLEEDNLLPEGLSYDNIIGEAHAKVSSFDSIAFISKEAMMEYHTIMGHNPDSMNPIKPVISSQGEGKTLLYGKTLFVYNPSIEGFFKKNKGIDILITKSGAKAYDSKYDKDGKEIETVIKGVRWDELSNHVIRNKNDIIRTIPIDGIGFRPEKDADRLSASESDQDYNYMDKVETGKAFSEIVDELIANLNEMENIMVDPYNLNAFMKRAMYEGNIPEGATDGALGNLSGMLYYLNLSKNETWATDASDYSINQVKKYLAKEYIDNIFGERRALTKRIAPEEELDDVESHRYGGQAFIISSPTAYQGEGKRTRLLPTLFNKANKMILRGQIMLSHNEKNIQLSEMSKAGKNIRIVQNEKIFTIDEFIEDVKSTGEEQNKLQSEEDKKIIDNLKDLLNNSTLEGAHLKIEAIAEALDKRYEIGIISRRNPRTRPNDITLLGLKGFLDEKQGLSAEINSFDIANVYEGDYDADKVDYFFAHSDYMFDYIARNQAYFVQGIDPSDVQAPSNFTFQLNAVDSRKQMLSKMGSSIAYKQGIGIVAKTVRKINYLQNLGNDDYLFDETKRERWSGEIRLNEQTGQYDGPALLYKSGEDEYVTIDTRTLAFYQRYALESQYILDGQNKLNSQIAANIYEWADKFLFPTNRESISPKEAKSQDLKSIIKNGQTVEGKRVRIFQKFKLDKTDNKYKATEDLNSADKLVIREFLNQQNKLLSAFGDETYVQGAKRKTSFYDLHMGSKIFRNFHKDIYKSMSRQLYYKKRKIDGDDKSYLESLLDVNNGAFKPIQDNLTDIYNGQGGGYLDRIAVEIAKREFLDTKKEYNLDTSTYLEVESWFEEMLGMPSKYVDFTGQEDGDPNLEFDSMPESDLESFSKKVIADTQDFNKRISLIKRLDKKKNFIWNSKYSPNWKKKKSGNIDWVIKKLKEDFNKKFQKDISKIHPKDLKYKEYVSIEDSDLKRSIIHFNTLHAFLRATPKGFGYDSWWATLDDDAKKDLKDLKDFNRQTYGGNTLLDNILPHKGRSILQNKDMLEYVVNHRVGIDNVFQLREKFLMEKISEHGINFLYAYMEPTRNRDAIGVFNNRPVAIPYKETQRYQHGIVLLSGIAKGSKVLSDDISVNQDNETMAKFVLESLAMGSDSYRKFFDKETGLRIADVQNDNLELFGLAPFDRNMQYRLQQNNDFDWVREMLPNNPLSTINKSVIAFYNDYVKLMPNKDSDEYQEFLTKLNDLEEMSARKDYVNPIRYMDLRLSLDEDFTKLTKMDIYNYEGDDGIPTDIRNNPIHKHNKFLKFGPKQVKTPAKVIKMLESVTKIQSSLMTASRQNPMKDSSYETFKTMGEYLDC